MLCKQEVAGSNPVASIQTGKGSEKLALWGAFGPQSSTPCRSSAGWCSKSGESTARKPQKEARSFLPTPMLHPSIPLPPALAGFRSPPAALSAGANGRARLPHAIGSNPANEEVLTWLDARFASFLDYVSTVRSHSAWSARWYVCGYQNLRRYLVDGVSLEPETFRQRLFGVDSWVHWNRSRGLGPVATNTYWRAVRRFFVDLEERDQVQNPFRGLKAPPLPRRNPKAHATAECRRILAAAENYPWPSRFEAVRAVALLGTVLYAGLRKSELLRLEMRDVDLVAGTILVLRGKGRYGGKDRTTYVPAELKAILRAYLDERNRHRITCPEFFASVQRRAGIRQGTLKRLVKLVRPAAGVPFSLHTLRHSYVTWLLRSGVPIHVAQDLAGHASVVTTSVYLRVFDEDKRAAVAKLHL